MGIYADAPPAQSSSVSQASGNILPAGYLGQFGGGSYKMFTLPSTNFTVPPGITLIRVRAVGAAGGGKTDGTGGGGGEYRHGEFAVIPGTVFEVKAGVGGDGEAIATDGGDSSFGTLLIAKGGRAGAPAGTPGAGVGGTGGTGGSYAAPGGSAGSANGSGGGGAGSQLGPGGRSGSAGGSGGGGIVGNSDAVAGSGGGSPFGNSIGRDAGPNIIGIRVNDNNNAMTVPLNNPINAVIRFPFDGFTGGGGYLHSNGAAPGGIGGGGSGQAAPAGNGPSAGGVGGGAGGSSIGAGIRGGGGGGMFGGFTATQSCRGGNGGIIVEW